VKLQWGDDGTQRRGGDATAVGVFLSGDEPSTFFYAEMAIMLLVLCRPRLLPRGLLWSGARFSDPEAIPPGAAQGGDRGPDTAASGAEIGLGEAAAIEGGQPA